MDAITIRQAERQDARCLNEALRRLSSYLGDSHAATEENLREVGFGKANVFKALLAERENDVVGATLLSPLYSTTRGAAGAFVSDLWVADELRGSGLGRRLLAYAIRLGEEQWGARFLKLNVYHSNSGAMSAYERMGFDALHEETMMSLESAAFERLRGLK